MTGSAPVVVAIVTPAMVPRPAARTRSRPLPRSLAASSGTRAARRRLSPGLAVRGLELERIDVETFGGGGRVTGPERGLGRRCAERHVGIDRVRETDVAAGALGQEPFLLEHVAVRLDEVAIRTDGRGDPGERRPVDAVEPAFRDVVLAQPGAFVPFEPRAVFGQIVQQQLGL